MDSKGDAGDTASDLDFLVPFIQRNIIGPIYPESRDQPTLESKRTHFFFRGKLVLWPNAECLACDTIYSLNALGQASSDPQDNTLECPGCKARLKVKLRATGIDLKEDQKKKPVYLPMRKDIEDYTEAEQEEFAQDDEQKMPFNEVVDFYTGKKQLYLALVKLYLATPMILLHSAEGIRKQPTLAYNLAFHDPTGSNLDKIFQLFRRAADLEIEKVNHKEVNNSSMGDILPSDHPGMQRENSDYKPLLQEKDFKEPIQMIKGPWVTMVWRDRRSEQDGEVAYRLLAYEEMDPAICVKTQLISKEKWTTKEIFHRIQLFIQELPFFEGSWIELCGSLHEVFDPELYPFDYTVIQGFTNFNFLGTGGEHQTDKEDCPRCLSLVSKQRNCLECGYQLMHWAEVSLYLFPCDNYGYRYELNKSFILNFIGLDTVENRVSFDEFQLLLTDRVIPLIRNQKLFKYSQIIVSCPEIPFRFIHSLDEYRVQVVQLNAKQNFEKLLDYIKFLKEQYKQIPQNYDFYRSALNYVPEKKKPITDGEKEMVIKKVNSLVSEELKKQEPKEASISAMLESEKKKEKEDNDSVPDLVPEDPRKLEKNLYIAQAKVIENAIIQQMKKEKKEEHKTVDNKKQEEEETQLMNILTSGQGITHKVMEDGQLKEVTHNNYVAATSYRKTEIPECIRSRFNLEPYSEPKKQEANPDNDSDDNCSRCSGGTTGNICPDCDLATSAATLSMEEALRDLRKPDKTTARRDDIKLATMIAMPLINLVYAGKIAEKSNAQLSGTKVCDKCGTIIRWQGGECWNCTVPCNMNGEKTCEGKTCDPNELSFCYCFHPDQCLLPECKLCEARKQDDVMSKEEQLQVLGDYFETPKKKEDSDDDSVPKLIEKPADVNIFQSKNCCKPSVWYEISRRIDELPELIEKPADVNCNGEPTCGGKTCDPRLLDECACFHPKREDCPDAECGLCSIRDCPYGCNIHYAKSGCPNCEAFIATTEQ